jgi:hypothetical protein
MPLKMKGNSLLKETRELKGQSIIRNILSKTPQEIDAHIESKVNTDCQNLAEVNATFLEIKTILQIVVKLLVRIAKTVLKDR